MLENVGIIFALTIAEQQNEEYERNICKLSRRGQFVTERRREKNMHGNPDKNLRSNIMRRIRQRSESGMTVCRGSLIAKLYDHLGVESKTIILPSYYCLPRIAISRENMSHRVTQRVWKSLKKKIVYNLVETFICLQFFRHNC